METHKHEENPLWWDPPLSPKLTYARTDMWNYACDKAREAWIKFENEWKIKKSSQLHLES